MLDLKPGQSVLDVGCGIGGSMFYMEQVRALTIPFIIINASVKNVVTIP